MNDLPFDALFLLDTGATTMIVTPLFARRIALAVPDDARRQELTVFGGQRSACTTASRTLAPSTACSASIFFAASG